jgi:hypothetical protein
MVLQPSFKRLSSLDFDAFSYQDHTLMRVSEYLFKVLEDDSSCVDRLLSED